MEHHITPKLANLAKTRKEVNKWYMDSCCGQHMVSSSIFILNNEELFNKVEITVANIQTIHARSRGQIQLESHDTGYSIHISDVLVVPKLQYNLLSLDQLMKRDVAKEKSRSQKIVVPPPEEPLELPVTIDTSIIGDTSGTYHGTTLQAVAVQVTPHAFEEDGDAICLLHKSLYDIKQTLRLWQHYLHTMLIELGFQQLPHDQGMYCLESHGSFTLLVAYVDDLLYTGDNTEVLDRFEHEIKEKLKGTIDHDVTQFLGLNVTQTADTIHLSAAKYTESLAKKFGIALIGITTPFRIPPPNHEPDTTPLSSADHRLYQQQLG
ncbi:unnamed protein product [Closterium sp. NIES-54]